MALKSYELVGQDTRLASVFVIVASLWLLAACETPGGFGGLGSGEARAARLADNGRFAAAADLYAGLAATAVGPERERLTMLAVENWLDAGDTTKARAAFQGMAQPAVAETLWRWQANRSALALYDGDPDTALSILEPLSREPLPVDLRLRAEALRADSWFQKGDPARATELML